jgi:hypothetical protein
MNLGLISHDQGIWNLPPRLKYDITDDYLSMNSQHLMGHLLCLIIQVNAVLPNDASNSIRLGL